MPTCADAFWASSVVAAAIRPYHEGMRAILLLLLLCPALLAQSLLQQYYPNKREVEVAALWYEAFQQSVIAECAAGRPVDADLQLSGKLSRCRISAASTASMTVNELWFTGTYAADTSPIEVLSPVQLTVDWVSFKPRQVAHMWPIAGEDDAAGRVGLVAWLYTAAAVNQANEALAKLWTTNGELRPQITELVRFKEAWDLDESAKLASRWDAEGRQFRNCLIGMSAGTQHEIELETAAQADLARIRAQLDDRDARTLTLDEIKYELDRFERNFGKTRFAMAARTDLANLRRRVEKDKLASDTMLQLAEQHEQAKKWKEAAEEYTRALKYDPIASRPLSRAAQAWLNYARPEVRPGNKLEATQEAGAKAAAPLFARWLERCPAHVTARLCYGMSLHISGDRKLAGDQYDIVLKLAPADSDAARDAKKYAALR